MEGRWRQLSLLGGTMLVENTEASLISGLLPVIRHSGHRVLGSVGLSPNSPGQSGRSRPLPEREPLPEMTGVGAATRPTAARSVVVWLRCG